MEENESRAEERTERNEEDEAEADEMKEEMKLKGGHRRAVESSTGTV